MILLFRFLTTYLQFTMLIFQISSAENWIKKAGKQPGTEVWKITNRHQVRKEIDRSNWEYERLNGDAYIVLTTEECGETEECEETEGSSTKIFRERGRVKLNHTIFYFHEQNKLKSHLETKLETADAVADLWHELTLRTKNEVPIIRGMYDSIFVQELQHILAHVELKQDYIPVNRIYAVTFTGIFFKIVQIPEMSVQTKRTVFLLDYPRSDRLMIFPYEHENDNENEKKQFKIICNLREFIIENERSQDMNNKLPYILTRNKNKELHCIRRVSGQDVEQQNDIKLFQYSEDKMEVQRRINLGLLNSCLIEPEHCYLLVKEGVKEAFVYIGKNSNYTEVKAILRYGEQLAHNEYLVTIVKNQNPPLPFTIAFTDIMELFVNQVDNKIIRDIIKHKFTLNIHNYYCHKHGKYYIKPT